jgi:hypothetical protein
MISPEMRRRAEILAFGGFRWVVIPGFSLSKEEIEMFNQTLPMMEKRIYRAVEWLKKFNYDEEIGEANFEGQISLSTVRYVPEGKTPEGGRMFHTAGFTGKYPALKQWLVRVSEGHGEKPFYLMLLKQSEELEDATYWQPICYNPVEKEDLRTE